ncbi:hypothetical protein HPP92_017833 [Vanilla planifolia]|uniref:Large ribosomal subunit protein uL18c n=1 Tax=Vanilla planifolia TaxID=51239 RepID=A0A835UQ07_VANPL|nr:hypothetical protein HPP92_017833 [Vanilla planifolia]
MYPSSALAVASSAPSLMLAPVASWYLSPSHGSGAFPSSLHLGLGVEISARGRRTSTWPKLPFIEARAKNSTENHGVRHERIRKKVHGTPERPRMCVFRSNKHLYVQVIDDTQMHTLASVSTMQKSISENIDYSSGPTIEVAKKLGEAIAKSCLQKGITQVTFDRGGYAYHGRVQALADAAREHGLLF